jgi:hypothetical protein
MAYNKPMDTNTSIELNIALIPTADSANRHIAVSQMVASRYPALVQLNGQHKLALAPHLTLYQLPVPLSNLQKLLRELQAVAAHMAAPDAQATQYVYNAGEASFELQYAVTDVLLAWQEQVIASANPLRGGLLLERDPAGNAVRDLLEKEGTVGDNIRATGYAEVGDPANGGLFRPHVTLNWLAPGTQLDGATANLPEVNTMDGTFPALGVYALGPQGTCPQRLAQFPCAG